MSIAQVALSVRLSRDCSLCNRQFVKIPFGHAANDQTTRPAKMAGQSGPAIDLPHVRCSPSGVLLSTPELSRPSASEEHEDDSPLRHKPRGYIAWRNVQVVCVEPSWRLRSP